MKEENPIKSRDTCIIVIDKFCEFCACKYSKYKKEVLLQAVYLSVDPYMRIEEFPKQVGSVMIGEQLSEYPAI